MAVKKTIELEVDLKKAQDDIRDIREQFAELKDSIKSVEDASKKQTKQNTKGFKLLKGAVDRAKKGISSMSLAIASIPVRIVQEAFSAFKEVLGQNQVVADAFAIAFGTVSNLFNDFINFVLKNWEKATKPITKFFSSNIFPAIEQTLGAITARFRNLIESVNGFSKAISKALKGDFAGAAQEAKLAIDNFGDAVFGNFVDTAKATEDVSNKLKEIGDIIKENTTGAYENAKAEVELRNAAALAAAEQEKLRIANLKAAEDQRQIRDDVSRSIEERIEANKQLGVILEEGIKQEKELATVQLAAAEAALANNSTNIELQAEVIRAQAAVLDIEERIGGLRSEQLTNENSLRQERLDLTLSQIDAENELLSVDQQLAIQLEKNILDRIELEKQANEQQKQAAQERTNAIIAEFGLYSQQAMESLKEQAVIFKQAENNKTLLTRQGEDARRDITLQTLNLIQSAFGEQTAVFKAAAIASAIINTREAFTAALGKKPYTLGNIALAGATLVAGFAQVKKIVATKIPGAKQIGSSADTSGGPAVAQAPAFNVVGQSPINQLAQTIGGQQPVKAYVVSSDVTTAQQLDRNIISESGI
jgi:hypothetical protein